MTRPATPSPLSAALRFAALASALVLALPALALAGGADDPEADLDATRDRRDELVSELALLNETDADLEARLAAAGARIGEQQQALVDAEAGLAEAEARVAELESSVAAARADVERYQSLVNERAVAAYMGAGDGSEGGLFGSDDYDEFQKMAALANEVAAHDRRVLADLDAAEAALAGEQAEAASARAEAEDLRRRADAALAELIAARDEEAAVRLVLQARIAEFESEVDALAAAEDDLLALIAARQQQTNQTSTTTVPPSSTTTTASTTTLPATSTTVGTGSTTTTTTPVTGSTTTITTLPPTTVPGGPAFSWPTQGILTSPFGPRWGRMHNGIDVANNTGTPINAAAAGEVFFAGWMSGYGNTVLVDHGNGWTTLYGHQSEVVAAEGQQVVAGELVGLMGSTGNSTGPHLHFEIRLWGVPHDPLLYLP